MRCDPTLRFGLINLNQVAAWYLLTFLPVLLFAISYRPIAKVSRLRSFALAHAFVLYGLIWAGAGLAARWRLLVGRRSWLKTDRLVEHPIATSRRAYPTLDHPSQVDWSWELPASAEQLESAGAGQRS